MASILLIGFFQFWSSCAVGEDSGAEVGDLGLALESLGNVGTLAAGFVMYNITTFNTEPGSDLHVLFPVR